MIDISVSTICGMSLGGEFVKKQPEEGIYESCLLIDILIFRFIIAFISNED